MNRRFIPVLLLLSWLFPRCAREVTVDLPEEETKAVVICHFSTGQPFQVSVSLSQPIHDASEPEIPETAEVSILQEGIFLDKLSRQTGSDGRFFWQSQVVAQAEALYTILVQVEDLDEAQASSAIPTFVPLQPLEVDSSDITITDLDEEKKLLSLPLKLVLERLPAEKRYFSFYLKHDLDVGQFVNGEWVTDFTYEGLQTNFSADGRTLALLHETVEPAVLINEKYWSDNSGSLLLDVRIPFDPLAGEKPRRIYVEWRTLSEEFYKYHLSLDRQGGNLPLSDPDALFNNVSGGYGNFSGYAVKVDTIELLF